MRRTRIRRKSRVFRRRHTGRIIAKVCLWLLVIPAVIAGYYLAQYLSTRDSAQSTDVSPVDTTTPTAAPTTPPEDDTVKEPDEQSLYRGWRAIYLPSSALSDMSAWEDTLAAASAAGYTAVIVDVKDADGALWYASATELAAESRAIRDDALSLTALRGVADTLEQQYQMTLIPRLYAFRDNTAPRYLPTARVSLEGDPSSGWFDADPSAGGRRWLNPYAPDARRYITDLVRELSDAGFSLLMLDGVQFPDREVRAYYGDAEQTVLSRAEILTQFASEVSQAVGEGSWLMSATALSTVGEQTTVYGGNPLTYGAPAVSPSCLLSQLGGTLQLGDEKITSPAAHPYEALNLLLSQLQARLQLMGDEDRPVVIPWLQADGLTADQLAQQQQAVSSCLGADAPYILYSASGQYTFPTV